MHLPTFGSTPGQFKMSLKIWHACLWTMRGSRNTRRKSMQSQEKYEKLWGIILKEQHKNLNWKSWQSKEDDPVYPVLTPDLSRGLTFLQLTHYPAVWSHAAKPQRQPLRFSATKDPISSGVRVQRVSMAGPITPCLVECGPRWASGIVTSPQDVR